MPVRHRIGKCVALICAMAVLSTTAFAQNPAATVNVNANHRAINPLIYGANWADRARLDADQPDDGAAELSERLGILPVGAALLTDRPN